MAAERVRLPVIVDLTVGLPYCTAAENVVFLGDWLAGCWAELVLLKE